MKPTTRLRILDHFRKHQTASVRELSRSMGMTGANIRHHLAVLESNDLIEVIGHRKEGRGRPMQVYGLSRRVLGDGLDYLAGAILDVWLGSNTVRLQETSLRAVAERLAGGAGVKTPVMKLLVRAVEGLNEMHYQAHWEASAAGPRLILGHCPYSAIIAEHPELCQMDSFLLEIKLGASVNQTSKLQLNDKGLPFCAFLLAGI
jgi:predicted ArsR family transcriptional regulator